MSSRASRWLLAIDADGVLLDFHDAYATAWERAFGHRPAIRHPDAYRCIDRWDVPRLDEKGRKYLRGFFDESLWSGMPAMPGALQACRDLVAAGHELVCVSAIVPQFEQARARNLERLGFPIGRVIATGNAQGSVSPKAAAVNSLRPRAFVDDFAPYFNGISCGIHAALIVGAPFRSPNVGAALQRADSTHGSLLDFSRHWLSRHAGRVAEPT